LKDLASVTAPANKEVYGWTRLYSNASSDPKCSKGKGSRVDDDDLYLHDAKP